MIENILKDLGLNFYEAGGVYAISRNSMCNKIEGDSEQEHYDNTLKILKEKTGKHLLWTSRCDDYMYLGELK